MKISYKHLINNIITKPSLSDLSGKLFQLGHEHEVSNNIFDFEFTPNRGDCLSLRGLLRDLKQYYDVTEEEIYKEKIKPYSLEFSNNAENHCKSICFLKIEISDIPSTYHGLLKNYFDDLNINKNNFFTDVSNFISYETGQPTHCYDTSLVNTPFKLDYLTEKKEFETLLEKKINLKEGSLVFLDKNDEVINLAGIVGGMSTSCNKNTKSVIVECAHFDPEIVIGKALNYGLNSEAAHKFERGTDPNCHENVLRRFIKIIEDHTSIIDLQLTPKTVNTYENKKLEFDEIKINKILGTNLSKKEISEILYKFGFEIKDNKIIVPSFRNDIYTLNDISEEVARAIGYDNLDSASFNIPFSKKLNRNSEENKLKSLLIENGFYEVINDPFVSEEKESAIEVDNPLDSKRKFLRTDLKASLINNLLYNERRQKDSIKLFEVSDVYLADTNSHKRVFGIIATGRVGKDYKSFSKKIDAKYLPHILQESIGKLENEVIEIKRDSIDTKIKDHITYIEIEINSQFKLNYVTNIKNKYDIDNIKYEPVSEYPSSSRDLSFSVKDFSKCKILEKSILSIKNPILKEVFVFDYYKNEKANEIKIGFRFTFQSVNSTITDKNVNNVIDKIISDAIKIGDVEIPGL